MRQYPNLGVFIKLFDALCLFAGGYTEAEFPRVRLSPQVNRHIFIGEFRRCRFLFPRYVHTQLFKFGGGQRLCNGFLNEGLAALIFYLIPFLFGLIEHKGRRFKHFCLHDLPQNIVGLSFRGDRGGADIVAVFA